ncbi:hypothetical protein MOB44_19665 [Bacillus sonorensis]|uniref:hypothetical protein n=1 Tax=Bacillus sonorensis TaxID=119858 RepID=UPI002282D76F|nr:hypothetical protein [Bacillus sonorensis]MCY7858844.1 hypothetical protein [Bacillus sonorensis]
MFKHNEINKIKESFDDLKNSDYIPIPFIDKQLNEVRRKDENDFETFRADFSNFDYNTVIGWEGQSYYYGYKEGFFNIAHMAIMDAKHQSDTLVYPIIFNYRHYLELVLKENILRFEIFFRLPISVNITHDLNYLLNQLIEILETYKLGFLISPMQKKVIQDFHHIDSNNDTFRFVYNLQGNLNHKYDHNTINLLSLHYTMNEVYNDFKAIDYLFEDFFHDSYLEPEYEGLIVALRHYLEDKKNKKGINSFNKLSGIVLRFEYKFADDKIFKFDSVNLLGDNEYKVECKNFPLTIIITVKDQKIESMRLK